MADPWLTIIGLGEDGLEGLSDASCTALVEAEIVFGGPRHLDLVQAGSKGRTWPVPFDLAPVLSEQGRRVVVLASGDPFWFGAGSMIAACLPPTVWRAYPAPGVFSLVCARLGWKMETTRCLGLHASSFATLRAVIGRSVKVIVTVRDGNAPAGLAAWLNKEGLGATRMIVFERVGGPQEIIRTTLAEEFNLSDITVPVAVALDGSELARGKGLSAAPGLPEDAFSQDGQITKAPVRAITLAALAPRTGELLWDIGGGSGSVSVEFCLAGGRAITLEKRPDRIANIRKNIFDFGLEGRMDAVEGEAPGSLMDLPTPDAVFVGGGADAALFEALWDRLEPGARLVANAVTLESEMLLSEFHACHGGNLIRIELAQAAPLGQSRGWDPSRPIVQWSVTR